MRLIRLLIPAIFLFTSGLAIAQEPAAAPTTPEARIAAEVRAAQPGTTAPAAPTAEARLTAEVRAASLAATSPAAPALNAELRAAGQAAELAARAGQEPRVAIGTPAPGAAEFPMAYTFSMDGAYLGIGTANVTSENAGRLGLSEPRGVVVDQVVADSPAAQAGLQKDDVILKLDGEEVSSVRKLTRLLGEVAPDHKVKLRISRGGREQDVTVTAGKRKGAMAWSGNFSELGKLYTEKGNLSADEMKKLEESMAKMKVDGFGKFDTVWAFGGGRWVGISTVGLTKQLADYFGVSGGSGVLVTNVYADSPASRSGIKAGDVITEVDGAKIDDSGDITRALNKKAEGDVQITVIRDRGQRMITVTPEKGKTGFNVQEGTLLKPSVMLRPNFGIPPLRGIAAPRVNIRPGVFTTVRRGTVIL